MTRKSEELKIPHEDALRILTKAVRHLERKLDLEEECPECGTSPITKGELDTLFNFLGKVSGVEGVADPKMESQAETPIGKVAFPVNRRAQ